ncbi:MAG: SIR2 family protein [Phycisphaerae bacterium]|nr:SIR2 family protein [Phycisphaerae bacterium]
MQVIEPLVSLSFAMQGNKGVFALLLGSGVSRAAGIPTGWEVVLELTRRLGTALGEEVGEDPAAWYQSKFGKAPDYSDLLNSLCKTPTERQQLLREFFEPNEIERQQGLKTPTKAHKAIARLVAQGFVRVIVTTNFDRLLERAIEDEGVSPVVLTSADATEGALPLAHQKVCVVKIHGDYLDSRIKNTPAELAEYDPRIGRLLDEVFENFGLVICGWSAQWDTALRTAIERSKSRRFSLYWASKGKLAPEAESLQRLRDGTTIEIADADAFFVKLQQLVEGLEQSRRPHPASIEALMALTKRLLSNPSEAIALSDLTHDESELARKALDSAFADILRRGGRPDVAAEFERLRACVERVQSLLICGAAWGTPAQRSQWVGVINRLAIPMSTNGVSPSNWLRLYPAMILLYAGGLAAISQGRLETLRAILYEPRLRENRKAAPLILDSFWSDLHDPVKSIKGHERHHTPRSEHLFSVMREPLRRFLPDDSQYDEAFDQLEYLIALTYLDLGDSASEFHGPWAPPGRFCWKCHHSQSGVLPDAEKSLAADSADWPPLKAGFFGGKPERAKDLQAKLRAFIGRLQYF